LNALRFDVRSRRNHAAADIVTGWSERDRAGFRVGQHDAADRNPVALMHVGRNDDELGARKAGCVDDLRVDVSVDVG
jgi:hypothetical protein